MMLITLLSETMLQLVSKSSIAGAVLLVHCFYTAPDQVPPLLVSFINDSPRVMRDSVEADILLSRPVQSLVCRLKRTQDPDYVEEADCENCTIGWAMVVGGEWRHATATLACTQYIQIFESM